MLETNLRYAPESATYDDLSENHLSFQAAHQNKKQNQLNTRVVRKFGNEQVGKSKVGLSGAVAQLHNKITDNDGSYYATGLHSISNNQRWNLQSSLIKSSFTYLNKIFK